MGRELANSSMLNHCCVKKADTETKLENWIKKEDKTEFSVSLYFSVHPSIWQWSNKSIRTLCPFPALDSHSQGHALNTLQLYAAKFRGSCGLCENIQSGMPSSKIWDMPSIGSKNCTILYFLLKSWEFWGCLVAQWLSICPWLKLWSWGSRIESCIRLPAGSPLLPLSMSLPLSLLTNY